MKRISIAIVATLLLMASTSFAATQAAGPTATTVSPQLQISATIQKAVSLTLKTGNNAGVTSHCTITATGQTPPEFTMNFGTVDALGINAGNCNVYGPANPGVDNAIYWTDYQIVPVYTSHQTYSNTNVTAYVSSDFAGPNNIFVVRDSLNSSTVPAAAANFTAVSLTGGASADVLAAGSTNVQTGKPITRFIGVAVKPDNGSTVLQGTQTATVTFTLTVQ